MPEPIHARKIKTPCSPQEIKEAIENLKRFYKVGQRSLKSCPGERPPSEAKTEAAKFGMNPEMVRKARLFATTEVKRGESKRGYTREELQYLFEMMRNLRWAVGISHIIRLTTVNLKHRAELERRMLNEQWSYLDLNNAINEKYGNRSPTRGRNPRLVADPKAARHQLRNLADQWERICSYLLPSEIEPLNSGFSQSELRALKHARKAIKNFEQQMTGAELRAMSKETNKMLAKSRKRDRELFPD